MFSIREQLPEVYSTGRSGNKCVMATTQYMNPISPEMELIHLILGMDKHRFFNVFFSTFLTASAC